MKTEREREREREQTEIETETEQHATVFEYCGCVFSLTKTPPHFAYNLCQGQSQSQKQET